MTLFSLLLGGGAGGLGGAAAAHILVTLGERFGHSELWLKGAHGPPFFSVSLYMGVLFAGIAWGLSRRLRDALCGFLAPFLGIAFPMAALTHFARWGADGTPTKAWYYAVLIVFTVSTWGTISLLGALSARGRRRWRGGLGAIGGAFASYIAVSTLLRIAPGLDQWFWYPRGFLPQATALLDGLMSGAGMGAGIFVALGGSNEKASGS